MSGCRDVVWYEGRQGLHELQSGGRHGWNINRHAQILKILFRQTSGVEFCKPVHIPIVIVIVISNRRPLERSCYKLFLIVSSVAARR